LLVEQLQKKLPIAAIALQRFCSGPVQIECKKGPETAAICGIFLTGSRSLTGDPTVPKKYLQIGGFL
jgi:hypothetical protein